LQPLQSRIGTLKDLGRKGVNLVDLGNWDLLIYPVLNECLGW